MDDKSKQGYSKDSPYKDEPYININSNKITMKNTDKNLIGIGIKGGKVVKILPMKGGKQEDYDFGDVDSVLEIPEFRSGGESQKPNPQNVGSFEDFYNQAFNKSFQEGGTIPKYQGAGTHMDKFGLDLTIPSFDPSTRMTGDTAAIGDAARMNFGFGNQATNQNIESLPEPYDFYNDPENISNKENHNGELQGYREAEEAYAQEQKSLRDKIRTKDDPTTTQAQTEAQGNAATTEPGAGTKNEYEKTEEEETEYENPYGGIDLETAFNMFGRGLGEKEGKGMTAMYGVKAALGSTRSLMSGLSAGKMSRHNKQGMKADEKEVSWEQKRDGGFLTKDEILEIRKFQDGGSQGDMDLSRKLTGDYVEGLANEKEEEAVAEAEDGEFIIHTDGQIVEIEGNKHGKKGGEKMNSSQIQEGDRFVSDHLKFSAKHAKEVSKEYGIKLKSKDTYAEGLRKIRKQLGLTNLIEEKEGIIKGIEKTKKDGDNRTSQLNLEFQTKKLNEIQQKEEEVRGAFSAAADKVFDIQESSKPKQKQVKEFQDGGMMDIHSLRTLAKKHGLSEEAAREVIKAFREGGEFDTPQYEDGAEHEKDKQKVTTTREENTNQDADGNRQSYTSKDLQYTGGVSEENFTEIMRELHSNFPLEVAANFTITGEGENMKYIPRAGVDSTKHLQEDINKNYESTIAEAQKISDPTLRKETEEKIRAEMFGGDGIKAVDGKFGDYTASREAFNIDIKTSVGMEMSDVGDFGNEEREGKRMPHLPNQSVLPPNAMAAHGKENYRFNRIEGNKVSPEQALAELGSQFDTGANQANNRPDSARGAILAQMMAGTQNQANKAITQANSMNQQDSNRVEMYNAQVGDKEMGANAQERLRFERMQMLAKENTDSDFRDYIDYNNKVKLQNYNTVNQMNLMNDLFDKFEYVDGEMRQKSGTTDFKPTKRPAQKVTTTKGKN